MINNFQSLQVPPDLFACLTPILVSELTKLPTSPTTTVIVEYLHTTFYPLFTKRMFSQLWRESNKEAEHYEQLRGYEYLSNVLVDLKDFRYMTPVAVYFLDKAKSEFNFNEDCFGLSFAQSIKTISQLTDTGIICVS